MPFNFNKKSGLTMVETLIAVTILATAFGSILTTFAITKMSALRVQHRIEAVNLLRAKMESLRSADYGDIDSESAQEILIDAGPDLTGDTADDVKGEQTVTVTDLNGYKEIKVTLAWEEIGWGKSQAVNENIATYMHKKLLNT